MRHQYSYVNDANKWVYFTATVAVWMWGYGMAFFRPVNISTITLGNIRDKGVDKFAPHPQRKLSYIAPANTTVELFKIF